MASDSQLKRQFELCVEMHADSMYRIAFRLTGCPELARELVQETYLNAWKNIDSLSDSEKMKSWMFAILRNQYTKLLRRIPRASQLTQSSLDNIRDHPESDQTNQQMIHEALQELDDDHKLPLLFVSMEGMSAVEAANILGIRRGTVLSRLHRGREKLKTILVRLNPDWLDTETLSSEKGTRNE